MSYPNSTNHVLEILFQLTIEAVEQWASSFKASIEISFLITWWCDTELSLGGVCTIWLTHFTVLHLNPRGGRWCTFSILFHYWSYIAVFFWDSVVLLSWRWDSCRNDQGAIKYSNSDGAHLLETDIPCSTFGNISPARRRNINPKVALLKKFFLPVRSAIVCFEQWAVLSKASSLWARGTSLFLSWVFRSLCNRRYNGCCQNCVVITDCVYQALNARPLKEMSRTLMSSRSIRCSQTSNWVSHWKAWRRKEILYPNRMQTCNRRFWFDCSSHFGTT